MKVKLLRTWGKHKAGEIVDVDEARAEQLRQDGYAAKGEKAKAKKG